MYLDYYADHYYHHYPSHEHCSSHLWEGAYCQCLTSTFRSSLGGFFWEATPSKPRVSKEDAKTTQHPVSEGRIVSDEWLWTGGSVKNRQEMQRAMAEEAKQRGCFYNGI